MEEDETRIGIFICHCGLNIGGVINIPDLREFCEKLDNVILVEDTEFLCSTIGQNLIKELSEKSRLNRILIASCSPRVHETTFRKLLDEININKYLLEIVNLREQCSWCHSDDPTAATEKAKDLIKMALARLKLLEALPTTKVNITKAVLIIGGGIAGMRAAIDIAKRKELNVYLLEKNPYLGGHIVQHNLIYPYNKNPMEIYNQYIQGVQNPKIKIITCSELENIDGYIGNFTVTIKRNPSFMNESCNLCGECEEVCPIEVENEFNLNLNKRKAIYLPFANAFPRRYIIDSSSCNRCGKCVEVCKQKAINLHDIGEFIELEIGTVIIATGFDIYEPKGEYGYGKSSNIVTLLQMERLLSENGPTNGKILRPSDSKKPDRIVFIGCVGSREPSNIITPRHYCSRICCSSLITNAIDIKEKGKDIDIVVLYRDIRTHGRDHEKIYTNARKKDIKFIRYSIDNKPEVIINPENNSFLIKVYDTLLQTNFIIPCDLIALASAIIPSGTTAKIASKLGISRSRDGFFQELHPKLAPLNTINKGIYIAGAAQAPKDIIDSIAQASGAATKALIPMVQEVIPIESAIANIDKSLCSGCGVCVETCPFNAIELEMIDSKKVAQIIEAACKGCGVCGSSCPAGAIKILHFTDKQINAELEALLKSI